MKLADHFLFSLHVHGLACAVGFPTVKKFFPMAVMAVALQLMLVIGWLGRADPCLAG